MFIYLIVTQWPQEDAKIQSAHTTKKFARQKLKKLRDKDEYKYQYTDITKIKLEP